MPINASELTAQQQITAIYVAYYDRAPDPAGLQFWVDQLNGGRSLDQIATDFSSAAETLEKYPFFATPDVASADTFLTSIYVNLFGRVPDQAGLDFWTDQLESGSTPVGEIILAIFEGAQDSADGNDLSTALNKIDVGLDWAQTAADNNVGTLESQIAFDDDGTLVIVDQDAFDSATSILDGVTGDAASVDAAKAATAEFFGGGTTPGQTFTLTEGSDIMPGLLGDEGSTDTSGDDLILAGTSVSGGIAANNLGSGDVINGGDGTDTLQITDTGGAVITGEISNVEVVNLQGVGINPVLNLINATGINQIWNDRTTATETVFVNDIQEEAVIGFNDTDASSVYTFANDVDFGGDLTVALDEAGDAADSSRLRVDGGNNGALTTLNVAALAGANFLTFNTADAADLETLNVSGDGALTLQDDSGDGSDEFNTVTQVNAEGLQGAFAIDLGANNQDIDFNGGPGATTLITGNGNSTIDTGDSADDVTVGNGDNTINTNGGDDAVVVGNGNNTIDTGDGNDTADITAGGDDNVTLGAGDDVLLAGAALTDTDAAEGGDGTDTLVVDVASAAAFTANGDVDAVVNGFEVLDLVGVVADPDNLTVDLDNIDDIQYVITDGTEVGGPAFGTPETADVTFTDLLEGQSVTVGGETYTAATDLTADQVAADFAATETVPDGVGGDYTAVVNGSTVTFTASTGGDAADLTASVGNTTPATFDAADVVAEAQGQAVVPGEAEVAEVSVGGLLAGESTTVTDNEGGGNRTVTGQGVTEVTAVELFNVLGTKDGALRGLLAGLDSITIDGLTVETDGLNDASLDDVTQALLTGATSGNAIVSGTYSTDWSVTSSGSGSLTYTSIVPDANVSDLPYDDTNYFYDSSATTTQGDDGNLTAAEVASALAGNVVSGATVTTAGTFDYVGAASGSTVTFTANTAEAKADLTASTTSGIQPTVTVTNQGVDGVAGQTETAEVSFEALNSGESITVAGRTVTADGGDLTAAEVEAAYLSGLDGATVVIGNASVSGTLTGWTVAEDVGGAGNSELEFTSTTVNTNVADIETTFGITQAPAPTVPTIVVTDGADSAGGVLNLEYTAPDGTLELGGANLGVTNVNVAGATGDADEFNFVLATGDNHDGDVNIAGIEVVNVTTEADNVPSNFDLTAPDMVTLNVTGTSGVDFTGPAAATANLETVNAGALDIATDEVGVNVTTGNVDGTTFNGSAGQDTFLGFAGDDVMNGGTGDDDLNGQGGSDVIDGGDGDDLIDGGAAGDNLTGGAGADTFFYDAVSDSQGIEVDTIADFVSGEDIIDLSTITGGVGSYTGEANGYGAVLTSLANTGDAQAVLDTSTSTLYVDVNGDAILDNNDMAIDLTGVTALDGTTDFTF